MYAVFGNFSKFASVFVGLVRKIILFSLGLIMIISEKIIFIFPIYFYFFFFNVKMEVGGVELLTS